MEPDSVTQLDFLLGTWVGEGTGHYPTIADFTYGETASFMRPPGKPFLAYQQRTVSLDDGRPLHAEAGYLRWVGGGHVELVLVQPSGVLEVGLGRLDVAAQRITVSADPVITTPTAKAVTAVERAITVDGDELRYVVRMAAVGQPLQDHLEARLRRQSG